MLYHPLFTFLSNHIMKIKILCLMLIFNLTGCITSSTLSEQQRPAHWGQMIDQKTNFYKINDMVYRSEQPSDELLPFLQQHTIAVVINLRSRDKDTQVLANYPIQLIHHPIHTWAIDRTDLLQVMKSIQTAKNNNKKVLLHCYHGSDRTGASIAMYRIIFENWTTEDALNEMKHGGYGFHPIWVNIEKNFSPENIKWIRQQLSNPL